MQLYFLVEDNPFYASLIEEALSNNETTIQVFEKGENCLAEISKQPDLIILDYYLDGELTGLDTLQRIKKESPETQVIFLTSQANMQVALNSLRFGAFDYIEKNETAIEALQDALDRLDILKKSAVKKEGSVFNLFKKSMVC